MRVGFTGSRTGITIVQNAELISLLASLKATEAHHGDCIGADDAFHKAALALEIPIIIHPPDKDTYRAFCEGAIEVKAPKPYLRRNDDIVNSTDVLIGCPKEFQEQFKGGTWYTIHYAQRQGHPITIVYPNGIQTHRGW
jgi:hypothetical protein